MTTDIQPNDNMAEAGRTILLREFINMQNYEAGSIDGSDIEDIHKMRVATRRMRSGFRMLGVYYKDKPTRPFIYQLKQIAKHLGKVRDLDIILEDITQYTDDPQTEAVTSVLRKQRTKAHKRLKKYLDGKSYRSFNKTFKTFLNKPGTAARPIKDVISPHQVRHVLPGVIHDQLALVKAYDTVVDDNIDVETLHALRIEFKRLRYLVEFFEDVLGNSLNKFIDDLKVIQDHLGRMNDIKTITYAVETICEDQNIAHPTHYLETLEKEQEENIAAFQAIWQKFNTRTVQSHLANAILALR
jgi:CHAD domain-containing protein